MTRPMRGRAPSKDDEIRAGIIEYLETAEGDILRSVGMIAGALGLEREFAQRLVRDMAKRGEIFEPVPRRYLHHDRRSHRAGAAPHVPERRRKTSSGAHGR